MTGPVSPQDVGQPPEQPLGGGRDSGRIEEREARRLAARLSAAQRRLGEPAVVAPLDASTGPGRAVPSEHAGRSTRRLIGRLQATWMRRRGRA